MGSANVVHVAEQTLATVCSIHPAVNPLGGLGKHVGSMLGLLGLGGVARLSSHRLWVAEQQLEREGRLRRELTAYLTLDLCPHAMERSEFGRQMSRMIATRSSFARAAVLLRDASGALSVAGSAGLDDLSVRALNRWGAEAVAHFATGTEERPQPGRSVGARTFAVELERRMEGSRETATLVGCSRAHITPMLSGSGPLGALVVCADPRRVHGAIPASEGIALLLQPIEALALRLTTQLAQASAWVSGKPAAKAREANARVRTPGHVVKGGHHAARGGEPVPSDAPKMTMRQLLEKTQTDRVVTMPRPSGGATGFPSARMWHQRGSSVGLSGLSGLGR